VRVLLHTGKGGVGKTTVSLATALAAARHGHRVRVLSVDPAHNLADLLGQPLDPRPTAIARDVTVHTVDANAELDQAWATVQGWLREWLRDEGRGVVGEELVLWPGMEELAALRTLRAVEAEGATDVCVVDCAPTAATLRLLRLPDAVRSFADTFFGLQRRGARWLRPVAERLGAGHLAPGEEVLDACERLLDDLEDVRHVLLDESRTSARLVVQPARMVVDEARRGYAYLCLHGVATDAVVINRVVPAELPGAALLVDGAAQRAELQRIEASFPLPAFRAAWRPEEPLGVDALEALGAALFGGRDPAARQMEGRPIRMSARDGEARLEIALPHVERGEVQVARLGRDLSLRVRDAHRLLALPDALAGRELRGVRLAAGVLTVRFA